MSIKPIETTYNNYRFRSRLEARWAVFLDTLSIKYEYEKEGYDLGDGVYYLPDFVLYEYANEIIDNSYELCDSMEFNQITLEIKGTMPTEQEIAKMARYADHDNSFYIAIGTPYKTEYDLYKINKEHELVKTQCRFMTCPLCGTTTINEVNSWGHHTYSDILNYAECDNDNPLWGMGILCMYCDVLNRSWKQNDKTIFYKGIVYTTDINTLCNGEKLTAAYNASRSARFEFDR